MKKSVRNVLLKGGFLTIFFALCIFLPYDKERPLTRSFMWIMMVAYYFLLTIVDAKILSDGAKGKARKKYDKVLVIGASVICVAGVIAGIYSFAISSSRGAIGAFSGIAIVLIFLRKNLKGESRFANTDEENEEIKDTCDSVSQP